MAEELRKNSNSRRDYMKFIIVKCKCGNEQKMFEAPASTIKCRVCGEPLALPTGGKAALIGKYIKDAE